MKTMRLLTLLLISCFAIGVCAQETDPRKKEITKIKKNSSYIYAEVTANTQQEAIDQATDMLHQNVNEYVAKEKKFRGAEKVATVNTNYAMDQITMPRANMYRAFMYVKKSDIIPVSNINVTDTPKEVREAASSSKNATVSPLSALDATTKEVMSELQTCKTTSELLQKMKDLKAQGKISSYNNLATLKNAEECVMVVFDKEKYVRAVLSSGETRFNAATNQPDALSNYAGCGAIGVKVNK